MLKRVSRACILVAALSVLGACESGGGGATAQLSPIEYSRTITLNVGESAIIHAYRAQCGSASAPSWDYTVGSGYLTPSSLGTYSDGGVGTRHSRSCGGATPARAIKFTAVTPGSETFEMFGDQVSITVAGG
jgi:hypothetical protein